MIPYTTNAKKRNKLKFHKVFVSIILVCELNFVKANLSIRNHLMPLTKSIPTRNLLHFGTKHKRTTLCSTKAKKPKRKNSGTGFYYGLSSDFLATKPSQESQESQESQDQTNQKSLDPISVQEILSDTLTEFRSTSEELRDTLAAIRQEMAELSRIQKNMLKQQHQTDQNDIEMNEDDDDDLSLNLSPAALRKKQRKRRQGFDNLARDVEEWAHNLLFEQNDDEDDWKNIECSKLLKNKFNKDGKIKCFLKWLPDSRCTNSEDEKEYPCIRCYTTIDAPIEDVCEYLSDESHMREYNDLVVKHKDLEDISPHSKICWGQCPQILFIKPRDFVTFCHHRWKKDGTQIVVNQAVDHNDAPATLEEGKGNACRAYALRGANFISRDPNDSNKTRFAILAHGDPGGNLPPWACKAAVNAVVPIEPFKLFYNIEKGIQKTQFKRDQTETVYSSSDLSGRTSRPGGLSQLGYACFWPEGGGLKEKEETYIDE